MRTRVALIAAIVASGGLLAGFAARSAAAAPLRNCTRTHGTIVAVDFAHWGGPIVRGCGVARHDGYALLHGAGFTTAGDAHDGPGIICRLGNSAFRHGVQYPTPKQESCIQTPPTTGYWAFWVARRGTNRWIYSPLGAMGDVPRPGEVELWIFGATNVAGTDGTAVPSFSPDALRPKGPVRIHAAATPTTRTTPSARTTPAVQSTTTTTARPTTTTPTRTRTRTATHSDTARASAPTRRHSRRTHRHHLAAASAPATATPSISTSTTTSEASGARIVSARPTSQRASAGSLTPLIVGGALAVLLCAGAGRAIRLRRREP